MHQNYYEPVHYVFYTSFCPAYIAMKLLNNFLLRHSGSTLKVEWCPAEDYSGFSYLLNDYHAKIEWSAPEALVKKDSCSSMTQYQKQCKLTCRYDIQIEN